jgi:hypothetical protein
MSSSCLKPCRLIALSEPFQGCCRYSTFLPTLSQSECVLCNLEGTCDGRIAINRFHWPLLGHYLLEVFHLVHCIRLLHLTLCWPSSSILFVVLTLVVSVMPKSYLCKIIVIVHAPLGCLLLSVTIPCRESKLITRLVNFRLGEA